MRRFLLTVSICLFCTSCGVKDNPEYKSLNRNNNTILIV